MLGQDGGFACLLLLLLQLWCFVVGIGWVVSWIQCDCCRDSERVQIESPKIRISATSPSLFLEEKVLFANSCWRGKRDRQDRHPEMVTMMRMSIMG